MIGTERLLQLWPSVVTALGPASQTLAVQLIVRLVSIASFDSDCYCHSEIVMAVVATAVVVEGGSHSKTEDLDLLPLLLHIAVVVDVELGHKIDYALDLIVDSSAVAVEAVAAEAAVVIVVAEVVAEVAVGMES